MHEFWVLGATATGAALAESLWRRGHTVYLWDEDAALANRIARTHVCPALPQVELGDTMDIVDHIGACGYCDGIVLCMPIDRVRAAARLLHKYICPRVGLISCVPGRESGTGKTAPQILAEELPGTPCTALAIDGEPIDILGAGPVPAVAGSDKPTEAKWTKGALRIPALAIETADSFEAAYREA